MGDAPSHAVPISYAFTSGVLVPPLKCYPTQFLSKMALTRKNALGAIQHIVEAQLHNPGLPILLVNIPRP